MIAAIASNNLTPMTQAPDAVRRDRAADATAPSAPGSVGPSTASPADSDAHGVNALGISVAVKRVAQVPDVLGPAEPTGRPSGTDASNGPSPSASPQSPLPGEKQLTPADERSVEQLEDRDREIRAHEQAHKAAAGPYSRGGPTFEYEVGPDGKRYAVDGEVQIDSAPVRGDPKVTIAKMQQIGRAALAPGTPSAQDRAVAEQARAVERAARSELARQRSPRRPDQDKHEELATMRGIAGPSSKRAAAEVPTLPKTDDEPDVASSALIQPLPEPSGAQPPPTGTDHERGNSGRDSGRGFATTPLGPSYSALTRTVGTRLDVTVY